VEESVFRKAAVPHTGISWPIAGVLRKSGRDFYLLPFTAVFLGASDLEAVGQETVNGLLTTRYRANFNRWVQTYLQVQADVSYAADGYVWFSEQYGVIVKSQVHVSWSAEGQEGEYEAQTEISQVGQIPPIALPQ